MKKLNSVLVFLIFAGLALSACSPAPTATDALVSPEDISLPETAPEEVEEPSLWTQEYITQVAPIMIIEPYFGIFGQSEGAVPYYYEEAVKLAGHSCGATAGAWTIARKALEVLYPDGETPVRGQIQVEAPGAEDEWFVGVHYRGSAKDRLQRLGFCRERPLHPAE